MLLIDLPKSFKVGNSMSCKIGDAADAHVTWCEASTFFIELDHAHNMLMRIIGMREKGDQTSFILCNADAISTEDHLAG